VGSTQPDRQASRTTLWMQGQQCMM
jgi:hypothetical protein